MALEFWGLCGQHRCRSEIIRLNLIWIIPAKGLMHAFFPPPSSSSFFLLSPPYCGPFLSFEFHLQTARHGLSGTWASQYPSCLSLPISYRCSDTN